MNLIRGFTNFYDIYEEMVKRFPDGSTFVEVGCLFGNSTIFLADRVRGYGKDISIFAVDLFDNQPCVWCEEDIQWQKKMGTYGRPQVFFQTFWAAVKQYGLTKYITPLVLPSVEASRFFDDKSLAFVFIDASHETEAVKKDIEAWMPKVQSGGVLAGHDLDWNTVKAAVDEMELPYVQRGTSWFVEIS